MKIFRLEVSNKCLDKGLKTVTILYLIKLNDS